MKKIIPLVLMMLSFGIHAQIVNIPDPNFKSKLIALGVDTNADGNIQTTEAAAVTTLDVSIGNISDLTGLEAFVNLYSFKSSFNPLGAVVIPNLTALHDVLFTDGTISSITADNLPSLDNFTCLQCPQLVFASVTNMPIMVNLDLALSESLTTIIATNNPSMTSFSESSPVIQSIDLSGATLFNNPGNIFFGATSLQTLNLTNCTSLETLFFSDTEENALTNLTLTGCTGLFQIGVDNCNLSSIDLSGLSSIFYFHAASNNLTSIDFTDNPNIAFVNVSGNLLNTLDLSICPNLDDLDCSNNPLTYLNIKNGRNEAILNIGNNLALTNICADDEQIAAVEALTNSNTTVSSYCTFIPGGDYNTIAGTVRFDENNNGCDAGDSTFPSYVRIDVSDGINNSATFVNTSGNYVLSTGAGTYFITPVLLNPAYFAISPGVGFADFPFLDNSVQTQDFCISATGNHPDLTVVLTGQTPRPGFNIRYKLIYTNNGNTIDSGSVSLTFDGARMDFVSSIPAVDNQSANLLTWNFSNLHSFESRSIEFYLHVNSPGDTPPVNIGDILPFTANITIPANEETPADNEFHVSQIVVNAIDPNEKSCSEGIYISPDKIGGYLHYNINFENVGSASAVNIVVKDVIDVTKLDINSLQVVYASRPVRVRLTGNVIEFIFENINLPPSSTDPIGGHGNVLFMVKTLQTLNAGDMVDNTAGIYFDYNAPITTNTARITFAELSSHQFSIDGSIIVYPNPVKDKVKISAKSELKSIEIYDVAGRILEKLSANKNSTEIDFSGKAKGIYFLKVNSSGGSKIEKIVKQ